MSQYLFVIIKLDAPPQTQTVQLRTQNLHKLDLYPTQQKNKGQSTVPVDHFVLGLLLQIKWADMRVLLTDLSHELDKFLSMLFEGLDGGVDAVLKKLISLKKINCFKL